jgi:hypothetical protein
MHGVPGSSMSAISHVKELDHHQKEKARVLLTTYTYGGATGLLLTGMALLPCCPLLMRPLRRAAVRGRGGGASNYRTGGDLPLTLTL